MSRAGRRVFVALLVLFGACYAWGLGGVPRIDPVTSHLSNFALTGLAVTLVGGPRAFTGEGGRRRGLAAAAALAVANVVLEVVLAVGSAGDRLNTALDGFNTPDPVDAIFGLAAVALVVAAMRPTSAARG